MKYSIQDLKTKCFKLGLNIPLTIKSKDFYLDLLKQYYIKRDYPSGKLPYPDIKHQLCFDSRNLPEDFWDSFKSEEWYYEEKFNGIRAWIHCVKDVGVFVVTRSVSDVNFRERDISAYFPQFKNLIPAFSASYDCELLYKKNFKTLKGKLLTDSLDKINTLLKYKAETAVKIMEENKEYITPVCFYVKSTRTVSSGNQVKFEYKLAISQYLFLERGLKLEDIMEIVNKKIEEGKEGIVLKKINKSMEYFPGKRLPYWIKFKKFTTLKAFPFAWEPGKLGTRIQDVIGAVKFKQAGAAQGFGLSKHIATVGSIPDKFRGFDIGPEEAFEKYFKGKEMTLTGFGISIEQKLMHARITGGLE